MRRRLYCPGPTPRIPQQDVYHHRTDEFGQIFLETKALLAELMETQQQPLLVSSTGSGAMEAAMVNFTDPDDVILTINAGKFGERWHKLGETYQCRCQVVDVTWGESASVDAVTTKLAATPNVKAVFFQASETSTGVYHPVRELAAAIRAQSEALVIVDAITGLVAHRIPMDDWGIDVLIGGSQKGFGVAPGLAFVALSERAAQRRSKRPKFYFDLEREAQMQSDGRSAWTPAIDLILDTRGALLRLKTIGFVSVAAEHQRRSQAIHSALSKLGFTPYGGESPSHAVTAAGVPPRVDGAQLVKDLRGNYQAIFAGGQDQWRGKILRFGHLGFIDRLDVIGGVAAIEWALQDLGHNVNFGDGVGAAMEVFHSS